MNNSAQPRRRTTWRLPVWLLVALAVVGAAAWTIAGLGRWLVIEDPLAPAQVIVVLSGSMPYRAMEAAKIFKQGFAPQVWITHPEGVEDLMEQLGIPYVGEAGYNRMVLERLGVPTQSIRILDEPVVNTEEEVRAISSELRRAGANRVILVTSMPHTRRVRTIWRALVGQSPQVIVRYTREDPFNANRWWDNTHDALDVVRETFGLLNAWARFPVPAFHR